jgi:hypothetical protein
MDVVLCRCVCRFNFGKALWYFPQTEVPNSWTIDQMQVGQARGSGV